MDSSDSSNKMVAKSGNTKQISPAIRWCFTLNNYSQDELIELKNICSNSSKYYILGFEVGESGTPHIQGYIEFKNKIRPKSIFKDGRHHWEKAKGSKQQNFNYCSKDGNYIINGEHIKPIKHITNLYKWQQNIINIINEEPDDRKINWIYEEKGNKGKSALCKYICIKYKRSIILSGKGADMKNGIMQFIEKNGFAPNIIIVDMPRSFNKDYLNISTLEEIKNGCFFSGKYEGGMCLFNSPHILVFSNEEPEYELMSNDRWNIIELGPES